MLFMLRVERNGRKNAVITPAGLRYYMARLKKKNENLRE